jgi:uncharacterized membrane protein
MHPSILEEYLTLLLSYAVPIVEACAAVVILLGVVRTVAQHLQHGLRLDTQRLQQRRSTLIHSLIMGLEFQVAADVLKTAMSPTLKEVAVLAALIALRTALGLLLERELHHVAALHMPDSSDEARSQ